MLAQALHKAEAILAEAGVASPRNDVHLMAAHLLNCQPMELFLKGDHDVPEHFWTWVERRKNREPLQHILQVTWFGPLELHVGPGVFIPRPETEVLADWAVRHTDSEDIVVDLCTGSGALAAYIAHEHPECSVWAVELSDAAMAFARRNLPDRVHLVQGDVTDPEILDHLSGAVDLLVSNPPYVPLSNDLEPEVYQDPSMAVFSGDSGMDTINAMIPVICRLLAPGGLVGIEHDDSTSEQTQQALIDHGGFSNIEPLKDLTDRSRFVVASKMP